MKHIMAIYATLAMLQPAIANPIVFLHKRDTIATQADLKRTISFFETAVRGATASANSSDLSGVIEHRVRTINDIIDGRIPITGVTIDDPESVKNFVLPHIWSPLCKLINCIPEVTPHTFPPPPPICDPEICNIVPEDIRCPYGFCGPQGLDGPIFPFNPVVDPVKPEFILLKLKNWATGSAPVEILSPSLLEHSDLDQLFSGLGNLATSWRYSFEQSSESSKALALRSPLDDGDLEKRISIEISTEDLQLIALIVVIILL